MLMFPIAQKRDDSVKHHLFFKTFIHYISKIPLKVYLLNTSKCTSFLSSLDKSIAPSNAAIKALAFSLNNVNYHNYCCY